MSEWIPIALIAVLAGAAVAFIAVETRRQANAQAAALREQLLAQIQAQMQAQMQSLLGTQAQSVGTQIGAQIGQLAQSVATQLGQVTQQIQSGTASAGALASDAQKAVAEQLQASTRMLSSLHQQLGEVQQAGRELSGAAKQIESVLGGAKTRGTLGEVALDRILADTLPIAAYEMQYRFTTGEAVDAVVRLDDKLLPIDSKFPLDDYRRLIEVGEDARKGFSSAVRSHVDSIAKKYVVPGEGTLDFALMFVPSEGVFYELLRSEDTKGNPLDQYCREKCVIPVSPNTLFAHLRAVSMALQGLQIEENAKRLQASISGLKKQLDDFGDVYLKLGTHLRNAQTSYADADRRLERARNKLDEVADGVPQEKLQEKLFKSASGA